MTPHHRSLAALALALSLAAAAALSAAPPAPDPIALLAGFKDACGGGAWDTVATLRSTGTLSIGGLEGSFEGVEDLLGGRSLVSYDLGVVKGEQGFDGERPWERTPAGEVVVKSAQGDLEGARTEAYRTARAFWFPERWPAQVAYDRRAELDGRACHVLRVHPRGGRPFEMWLDAETLQLARTVEQGSTLTTTTTYSDWRSVGGLLLPFASFSTGGQPGTETTIALERLETAPETAAAAFAPPQVKHEDFAIAGGASASTVPFELLNNHIYVQARVNGGPPRRFLVDTGGANLLTKAAADALGVRAEGAVHVGGVGEKGEQAGFARLETLTLGEITFTQPLFVVLPFAGIAEATGVELDGLVGFEVFQRFVVTIDYAAGTLTLTRPEAARPRAGVEVPFRFQGNHPVVDGSVEGLAGTFTIDTGSRGALALHRPFVVEHGLEERFQPGAETVTGWGVGGPARGRLAGERALRLGTVEIPGVLTELSAQTKGAFTDRYVAGNVGGGVLKRFTVTFDYPRQMMVLEPNGRPGDAPDRSGVWLNAVDGVFRVEAVAAGSPAADAGLVVGDRVVAVDGTRVAQLRLPDVRERLRGQPGTVVVLTVAPAAALPREVPLSLRDNW